jgi:TonB family protein
MKNLPHRLIAFILMVLPVIMVSPSWCYPAYPAADLGTWWKDSGVVRDLRLRDSQIRQIEQAFLKHRSELGNLANELQPQEAILQSLIDSASIDEKRAAAQIEQVVAARGRLEREKTIMALDIRCAVTLDQWKKLQEIQRAQSNPTVTPAATGNKVAPQTEGSASGSEEPVYQIGGPVTDPVPMQKPMPGFTSEARAQKVEGSVLLEVVIGKDGIARSAKVLRGIGFGLDESAVETVTKRWLFKPATLNGQPVSVQAKIEVTFRQF